MKHNAVVILRSRKEQALSDKYNKWVSQLQKLTCIRLRGLLGALTSDWLVLHTDPFIPNLCCLSVSHSSPRLCRQESRSDLLPATNWQPWCQTSVAVLTVWPDWKPPGNMHKQTSKWKTRCVKYTKGQNTAVSGALLGTVCVILKAMPGIKQTPQPYFPQLVRYPLFFSRTQTIVQLCFFTELPEVSEMSSSIQKNY